MEAAAVMMDVHDDFVCDETDVLSHLDSDIEMHFSEQTLYLEKRPLSPLTFSEPSDAPLRLQSLPQESSESPVIVIENPSPNPLLTNHPQRLAPPSAKSLAQDIYMEIHISKDHLPVAKEPPETTLSSAYKLNTPPLSSTSELTLSSLENHLMITENHLSNPLPSGNPDKMLSTPPPSVQYVPQEILDDHSSLNHLNMAENPPPKKHHYKLRTAHPPIPPDKDLPLNIQKSSSRIRDRPKRVTLKDQQLEECRSLLIKLNILYKDPTMSRFICYLCESSLASKPLLVEHVLAVHMGLLRYHCTVCYQRFVRSSDVTRHMYRAHPSSQDLFGEIEGIRRLLADHRLISLPHHHGQMRLIIQYFMHRHQREEHFQIVPIKFGDFEGCENLFSEFSALKHFQSCHSESLTCGLCKERILQDALVCKSTLLGYVREWVNSVSPQANVKKPKKSDSNYSTPTVKENSENKAGTDSKDSKPSIKLKEINKPVKSKEFVCALCKSQFRHENLMESHWYLCHGCCRPQFTEVHLSRALIPCGLCKRVFREQSTLNTHMGQDHAAPYSCPRCAFLCSSMAIMECHLTTIHHMKPIARTPSTVLDQPQIAVRGNITENSHREEENKTNFEFVSCSDENIPDFEFINEDPMVMDDLKIVEVDWQSQSPCSENIPENSVKLPYPEESPDPTSNHSSVSDSVVCLKSEIPDDVENAIHSKIEKNPNLEINESFSRVLPKIFKCNFCGIEKLSKSSIKVHLFSVHFQYLHCCTFCCFRTYAKPTMVSHLVNHEISALQDHTYSLKYRVELSVRNPVRDPHQEKDSIAEKGQELSRKTCTEERLVYVPDIADTQEIPHTTEEKNLERDSVIDKGDKNISKILKKKEPVYIRKFPSRKYGLIDQVMTPAVSEEHEYCQDNSELSHQNFDDGSDSEKSDEEFSNSTESPELLTESITPWSGYYESASNLPKLAPKKLSRAQKLLSELQNVCSKVLEMSRDPTDAKFVCYLCGWRAAKFRGELRHHILRTHYRVRRCFCYYCSYTGYEALTKHVEDKHAGKAVRYLVLSDMDECFKLHVQNKTITTKMLIKAFCSGKVKSLTVEPGNHKIAERKNNPNLEISYIKQIGKKHIYICKFCKNDFKTVQELRSHLNSSTPSSCTSPQNLLCCKLGEFLSYRHRKHQWFTHSWENPEFSEVCDHRLSSAQDLMSHFLSYHKDQVRCPNPQCRGEMVFSSELCTPGDLCLAIWEYESVKHVAWDIIIHSSMGKSKSFKCFKCIKDFLSLRSLKKHLLIFHCGVKRYKCTICPYSAYRRQDVSSHYCTVHSDPGGRVHVTIIDSEFLWVKNLACHHCEAKFYRNGDLTKHVLKEHAEDHSSESTDSVGLFMEGVTVKNEYTEFPQVFGMLGENEHGSGGSYGADGFYGPSVSAGPRNSELKISDEWSGQVAGRANEQTRNGPRIKLEQDQDTFYTDPFWRFNSVTIKQEPGSYPESTLSSGEIAPPCKRRRVTSRPYPDSIPPVPGGCLPCSVQL